MPIQFSFSSKDELGAKEEELVKVGTELKRGWECLGSTNSGDSTSGIDSPRSVAGKFVVAVLVFMIYHHCNLFVLYCTFSRDPITCN